MEKALNSELSAGKRVRLLISILTIASVTTTIAMLLLFQRSLDEIETQSEINGATEAPKDLPSSKTLRNTIDSQRAVILEVGVLVEAMVIGLAWAAGTTIRKQISQVEMAIISLHEARDKEMLAAESLRKSEAMARAISLKALTGERQVRDFFKFAPLGIFLMSESGKILKANKTQIEIIGVPMNKLLGSSIADYCELPSVLNSILEPLRKNETLDGFELRIQCRDRDRTFKDVLIDANALFEDGKFIHARCFMRDISQEKKMRMDRDNMEVQLRQAQKLESIGQLAAGIAHEINTPTQYIGDNLRFLKESFQDIQSMSEAQKALCQKVCAGNASIEDAEVAQNAAQSIDYEYLCKEVPNAIEQSIDGVQRVTEIVGAMKDFSHPGQTKKALTDINRAIQSTLTVSRNEWKYAADVELSLGDNLPHLLCLPHELNQVFLNIIVNAAHAISEANRSTGRERGKISISTSAQNGTLQVTIGDTGTGIPESARHRVFDPFFTTKGVGKGTGQGLAIAQNVITKKHNGSISFETELGVGTKFIIQIPYQQTLDEDLIPSSVAQLEKFAS